MPTKSEVRLLNEEVAQKLIDEAKVNPKMPYFGKFVGIANGQIVAVADNWDQMSRQLRQAEPDPAKSYCVEVGRDYDEVQEIGPSPRNGRATVPAKNDVRLLNEEVAQKLVDEAKVNPRMAYYGKFVGIANGKIVAVADDLDELARQLRQTEPDTAKTFCLEVGPDYDEVEEIGLSTRNGNATMPTKSGVRLLNEEVAQKLIDEAKRNSQMPNFGKFVGIANGQIVAVADDLDDLSRALRQAEPDPTKTFWVELGRNYDEVQEIWELN